MTMIDPEPARSNNWYWIGRKRRNSAPLEFSESISDRFVEGKETIDGTISVDGVTDKTQASGRLYSARRIGIVIDKSD